MTTFAYQVRDKDGKRVRGLIEAVSEKIAADRLSEQGYLINRIVTKKNLSLPFLLSRRIPADDLTMFYFQLGNLLESGVPLLTALQNMLGQIEHQKLNQVVQRLIVRIQNGASMSEAMDEEPNIFLLLYRSIIRVGETSGHLSQNVKYIAELNEARSELNHQVASSLAYPIVLIVASFAVVTFMIVWIIPTFTAIFTKAGIPLPLPTRILYHLSQFVKTHPLLLIVSATSLIAGFKSLMHIRSFKYQWDRFVISLPYVGLLIKRIEIARWTRSLALMLSSGVPVLKALEISKLLTQNLIFKENYADAYTSVQGGGKLADTLRKNGVFPNDVIQMISTGENSGTLDKMLYKICNFYDQLIARSLKKMTSMIEPVFILLMGGIVGFIMLSILLPIFDMIKLVNH